MNRSWAANFRKKLLDWYQKHKRDLPWRRSRDPYAIWVSEIMLQQTQVATVIPYYERFLKKFPTIAALARAEEEEVLALWAGLGYYRRAKLLQRGARAVAERHGGRLPDDPEALRELPGIGPYTAGAIASIAFQRPSPLVDGNVVRVLSRVFARKGHAKDARLQKEIWALAADLVDPKHPGDFNQALMELGATLCRVALPSCERCPVQGLCAAHRAGEPEAFPESPPPQKTLRLQRAAAVALRGESVLLVKPRAARWFQGLWGLPHEYCAEAPTFEAALGECLRSHLGLALTQPYPLPATTHAITQHRITTWAWLGEAKGRLKAVGPFAEARFFTKKELAGAALPNFDRKVLATAELI